MSARASLICGPAPTTSPVCPPPCEWGGGHTWWEPVRGSVWPYGFGSTEISLVAGS